LAKESWEICTGQLILQPISFKPGRLLGTFKALKQVLGDARCPTHYLATPPALFAMVIKGLGATGLADQARVIVEKPFGRDPASAREFNRIAL